MEEMRGKAEVSLSALRKKEIGDAQTADEACEGKSCAEAENQINLDKEKYLQLTASHDALGDGEGEVAEGLAVQDPGLGQLQGHVGGGGVG